MGETPTILDDTLDTPAAAPHSRRLASPSTLLLLYRHLSNLFAAMPGPRVLWGRRTYTALFVLIAVWGALLYATWATWGDLTIDSGHEMYVPAMLASGKMLYRDVWFIYGPAAPYFNSYLFRLFGIHLNVLYWAGSLAALGSAIFLYLTGMSLGSWVIGWTAGAVVLMEAFEPGLFCFPLPYSFSAVYGCLSACVFVWLVVRATQSGRWLWMFGAGTVAAVALLLKLEFGMACYGTVLALVLAESLRRHSWKPVWTGTIAVLPGVLACLVVARWMVTIAGTDFITQENFMSWPTSYFMRVYGKMWLGLTGFNLSWDALVGAFGRVSTFAGVALGVHMLVRRKQADGGLLLLALGLGIAALDSLSPVLVVKGAVFLNEHALLGALGCISTFAGVALGRHLFLGRKWADGGLLLVALGSSIAAIVCFSPSLVLPGVLSLRRVFFPVDMVLIVGLAAAAAWWFGHRRSFSGGSLAIAILFTFAGLLAFRILMGMQPTGYSIYYNGTVILSFLLLGSCLIVPGLRRSRTFVLRSELVVCSCCLIWVITHAQVFVGPHNRLEPLTTERGIIWTSKHMVANYQKAIAFMKEKAAAGDFVLSVPEDTSLYFLSGTVCPTRVYQFTPGVLAPGKMTEDTINEIERKKVRYLLWSNRSFAEYGVPTFGRDYDTVFAGYLTSHYRPVRPLVADGGAGWAAMVWERVRDGSAAGQHEKVHQPAG
jgi:hypothetical protein